MLSILQHKQLFLVALLLLTCTAHAHGQGGRYWTFADLHAEADLVAIGVCEETAETGRDRNRDLTPGIPVIVMGTTFVVQAVLKDSEGTIGVGDAVQLRHFRYDFEEWMGEIGVEPGEPFGYGNAGTVVVPQLGGTYLLFLESVGEGEYAPLSGQTFPSRSVFPFDGLP